MDLNKPVELMNDEEKSAYYMQRRKAILAGDGGLMPSGMTCLEERLQYIQQCNADPFRTLPGVGVVDDLVGGSELPVAMAVAPELEDGEASDTGVVNKRCC